MGSFSLSWPIIVILNYFVNVHWTSLRDEISKLQFLVTLKCNGGVFTPPSRFQQQFSWLSAIFFIKLSALTIFLLNQTSSFINILQIIDRKLIFDKVFAPTTDTKALRAHLANIVDPFQSSWTNGKRFAYVSIVQWGSEVPSYTKIISAKEISIFRDWLLNKRSLVKCLP